MPIFLIYILHMPESRIYIKMQYYPCREVTRTWRKTRKRRVALYVIWGCTKPSGRVGYSARFLSVPRRVKWPSSVQILQGSSVQLPEGLIRTIQSLPLSLNLLWSLENMKVIKLWKKVLYSGLLIFFLHCLLFSGLLSLFYFKSDCPPTSDILLPYDLHLELVFNFTKKSSLN